MDKKQIEQLKTRRAELDGAYSFENNEIEKEIAWIDAELGKAKPSKKRAS